MMFSIKVIKYLKENSRYNSLNKYLREFTDMLLNDADRVQMDFTIKDFFTEIFNMDGFNEDKMRQYHGHIINPITFQFIEILLSEMAVDIDDVDSYILKLIEMNPGARHCNKKENVTNRIVSVYRKNLAHIVNLIKTTTHIGYYNYEKFSTIAYIIEEILGQFPEEKDNCYNVLKESIKWELGQRTISTSCLSRAMPLITEHYNDLFEYSLDLYAKNIISKRDYNSYGYTFYRYTGENELIYKYELCVDLLEGQYLSLSVPYFIEEFVKCLKETIDNHEDGIILCHKGNFMFFDILVKNNQIEWFKEQMGEHHCRRLYDIYIDSMEFKQLKSKKYCVILNDYDNIRILQHFYFLSKLTDNGLDRIREIYRDSSKQKDFSDYIDERVLAENPLLLLDLQDVTIKNILSMENAYTLEGIDLLYRISTRDFPKEIMDNTQFKLLLMKNSLKR